MHQICRQNLKNVTLKETMRFFSIVVVVAVVVVVVVVVVDVVAVVNVVN